MTDMLEVQSTIIKQEANGEVDKIVFQRDGFFNERFDILVAVIGSLQTGTISSAVRLDVDGMIEIRNWLNKQLEGL